MLRNPSAASAIRAKLPATLAATTPAAVVFKNDLRDQFPCCTRMHFSPGCNWPKFRLCVLKPGAAFDSQAMRQSPCAPLQFANDTSEQGPVKQPRGAQK